MSEYNEELTEKEMGEAAGGKQARRSEDPTGTAGKQTRPTRDGKLTFRRQDAPDR